MSDFVDIVDVSIFFEYTELDSGVDFTETGDLGQIEIASEGWGDDWGGPWGDGTTIIVQVPPTSWTNVETP